VTRIPTSMIVVVAAIAVFGGMAIAAQDRYTLKLGKLEFADFRGYENWKDVAVSQTETLMKVRNVSVHHPIADIRAGIAG
jgi:hypothetical protein